MKGACVLLFFMAGARLQTAPGWPTLPPGGTVEWSAGSLDVTVSITANGTLELWVDEEPVAQAITLRGGTAVVRPGHVGDHARLMLPQGSTLNLRTHSGDVHVEGRFERVTLQTVSGNVTGMVTSGEMVIKTMSGDVDLTLFTPRAQVETISGNVMLHGDVGDLGLHTTSGDGTVTGTLPQRLAAQSVSGDLRFTGDLRPGARLTLTTISGDITVVPRGVEFGAVAKSRSGKVSVRGGLLGMEPAATGCARLEAHSLSGAIDLGP